MQGTNWVKVGDQDPPSKTDVLCCNIFTGDSFTADKLETFNTSSGLKARAFYRGDPQWIATHWMPLPPMPEGE
ncbi:DUF551 domain-containing protein [Providencia rettgeri]